MVSDCVLGKKEVKRINLQKNKYSSFQNIVLIQKCLSYKNFKLYANWKTKKFPAV